MSTGSEERSREEGGEGELARRCKAVLGRFGREELHTLASTTLGTLLVCFAIAALVMPYRFAGAGVTGIALLTNYVWGISPAWTIGVANVLLLVWGWGYLSPRFALWTLYVSCLTPLILPIFEAFPYPLIEEPVLAALLSGVTSGLGFGLLFRSDASSGGMDIVSMAASKRWGLDVGAASFYINAIILVCSYVVVPLDRILLGGLVLYVETRTIDSVVRSFNRQTQILVVSPRARDVADMIMSILDRTATMIPVRGAYLGTQSDMLLVVLSRRQVPSLKRYIASVDPNAFVIFSDVSEVVGEGFKSWLHI
ncbi:MAG: YitT family protein [Synergistaceae bacterium]|nr:YitT family protein [Synergistaceae bacterium]